MKYKAILFDMNGVLVDDEHLQEEAFKQTLSQIDIPLTPEDYIRFFIGKTDYKGFDDYFQFLSIDRDIDFLIAQKSKEYEKLASHGIKGYPGVKEFVKAATKHGLSLAVVTSSMKNEAISVLAGLGLAHYFRSIVAADDVRNGKPDPEGYLKGAASLSVDPSECIVIEDAPSGLKAAKSAEMFSIAVLNTHEADKLFDANIITAELSAVLINELI
jgi:HAD superfamily hydrolase (TIGR01509 family)